MITKISSLNFPGVSHVVYAEEMDSTQTMARGLAQDGAPSGTLVWAKSQKAGRGRMERTWASPPGGLYFSLLLRPSFPPAKLADLSLKTASCVSQAIVQLTKISTRIKPPNDIYARQGKQWLKLAGILAEAAGNTQSLSWLIVGIGVNINNLPPLDSATSIKAITHKEWDIEHLLFLILNEFQSAYALTGAD